jgi:hypothetical protein
MRTLINFVAFYVGWFACVAGAGQGWPYLGAVAVTGVLALHLAMAAAPWRELRVILLVTALGYSADSLQMAAGVLAFPHHDPASWLPPLWLLALWVAFATTLNVSFQWLVGRPVAAALLGAIAGPMSYYAGVRLGAAWFPNPALSLVALGIEWAVMMPALLWLAQRLSRSRPACESVRTKLESLQLAP